MSVKRVIKSEVTYKIPHQDVWSYIEGKIRGQKPSAAALECSQTGQIYSYDDVLRGSANWAEVFLEHSLNGKRPTVAIISPNSIEVPIVALGAMRSGCCVQMIHHNVSFDFMNIMLEEGGSTIVVSDVTLTNTIKKLKDALPTRTFQVFFNGLEENNERSVSGIIKKKRCSPLQQLKINLEDDALIFYSSGTTGRPKGIVLTHWSSLYTIYCRRTNPQAKDYPSMSSRKQEVRMLYSPLVHTVGLLSCFAHLTEGAKVVIAKSFNFKEIIETARKYKPEIVTLRPSFLEEISRMEDPAEYLGSIKMFYNIGAPLNPSAIMKIKEKLSSIVKNDYGTSEVGMIGLTPLKDSHHNLGMKLLPNTELRVIDEKTKDLGPNQMGELLIRTPRCFKGYLNNPIATANALDSDGWFHTGDIGYYSEDQHIFIVDRIKDVIVVNGVQVFPLEIEKILQSHTSVLEAGVVGIPDKKSGEAAKAFVIKKEDSTTEDDLVKYVNERVKKREERINEVHFISSFPRNHMGKIQKKLLKEIAWK